MYQPPQTSTESAYYSIHADHENGWVFVEWKQLISESSMRQGLTELLAVMRITKLKRVMHYSCKVPASFDFRQAAAHIAAEFVDDFLALGIEASAMVVAEETYTRLRVEGLASGLKQETGQRNAALQHGTFESIPDAIDWMKSI